MIAAQRGQQRVGGGQIGVGNARSVRAAASAPAGRSPSPGCRLGITPARRRIARRCAACGSRTERNAVRAARPRRRTGCKCWWSGPAAETRSPDRRTAMPVDDARRRTVCVVEKISVRQIEAAADFVGESRRGVQRQETATKSAWVGLVTLGMAEKSFSASGRSELSRFHAYVPLTAWRVVML